MENGAFSQKDFAKTIGDRALLFAHVTTRIPEHPNDGMLSDVGGRGFPTIALLSPDGELIGRHSGPRSVEGLAAAIDRAAGLINSRAMVAAGDEAAKADLLLYELGFGIVADFKTATQRFEELKKVTPEQEKEIGGLMAGLEFSDVMAQRKTLGGKGVAAKAYEMYQAGRIVTGDIEADFWLSGVLAHAMFQRDIKLGEEVAEKLSKMESFQDPGTAAILKRMLARLRNHDK